MTKLRISIRLKMLLVLSGVLAMAVGTYLYLATSLFTRDKLAYVFDLNASLVATISEQTRANLNVAAKIIALAARDILRVTTPQEQAAVAQDLFQREKDFLCIELYHRPAKTQRFERRQRFCNTQRLEQAELTIDDIAYMRQKAPLPLEAVVANKDIFIRNSSLPPEAAMLTLAIPISSNSGDIVVATDFRHESLLRIYKQSKLHETFLVDEHGRVLAHPVADKVIDAADMSHHALVRQALSSKVRQQVKEFAAKDGAAMLGAFAQVGMGRMLVVTQIPKKEALKAGRNLIERSIYFAALILLAAFMVSIVFARFLAAPIRNLRAATEVIGTGDFNVQIPVTSSDEIGDLARSFTQMATRLKETQTQLLQSEKMAAFGQLGAGITHEVKNPMTGIIGFAQIGQASEDHEEAKELFQLIEAEGVRCKDILVNFLKFARAEQTDLLPAELNQIVTDGAKIFSHQLGMHRIRVKLELSEEPLPIIGNAQQLQQILLNFAMNAQQAMSEGGEVTISTARSSGQQVTLTFSDNGPGMPEEVRRKVFEPFFTTKPAGEGTGLGLAITFGIIRDHHGSIAVESELGKGTSFIIQLPLANEDNQPGLVSA